MNINSTQRDARDVPVSTCEQSSLDDYEIALRQFQSYVGDPTETLSATLENDPEFVVGHIFTACAMMLMSERQYLGEARACIERAESLANKANDRERLLVQAARHWLEGRWDSACVTWDQVLARYPRDAMALQCAHLTDFLVGDAVNLRDRIGRVMHQWDEDVPGYSYILGMQAFGFEECNQFDRAEETGRRALEIESRDGWSVHAVAHVLEMQNRFEEGAAFLQSRENDWAPDNGFAFHNWWHLALFKLENEDTDAALALFDEQIHVDDSDVSMQLLDATALLWRLHLLGVDLGGRGAATAALWKKKTAVENGYYAFNDYHAVLACLMGDEVSEAESILADMRAACDENPALTAMMQRDVGVPASRAAIAFAQGNYSETVELLYPLRPKAHRFGGSNAQRDILSQTLIQAAIRSGQSDLAQLLISEREMHKPFSPLTSRFAAHLAH
ncbi:MAG: tetratricopeptide repeat protein [Pseudomonadota bacterium]